MDSKRLWGIIILVQLIAMVYADHEIRQEGPDYYIATAQLTCYNNFNWNAIPQELSDFYQTQATLLQCPIVTEPAKQRLIELLKGQKEPPTLEYSVLFSIVSQKESKFDLEARSNNREYAIRFLNEAMKEFVDYKKKMEEETKDTLIREIQHEKEKYEKAERELLKFEKENDVKGFESGGGTQQGYEKRSKWLSLKEDVARAKTFYEALTERLKKGTDSDWPTYELKSASAPLEPSGPNRARILIRSSLLGLIVSLTICLALCFQKKVFA